MAVPSRSGAAGDWRGGVMGAELQPGSRIEPRVDLSARSRRSILSVRAEPFFTYPVRLMIGMALSLATTGALFNLPFLTPRPGAVFLGYFEEGELVESLDPLLPQVHAYFVSLPAMKTGPDDETGAAETRGQPEPALRPDEELPFQPAFTSQATLLPPIPKLDPIIPMRHKPIEEAEDEVVDLPHGEEWISAMTVMLADVDIRPRMRNGIDRPTLMINYPNDARRSGIQGVLVLSFTVDLDGSATGVRVIQSLYPSCDSAAVEAIRGATFTPGQRNGRSVRVRVTLPVRFIFKG